MGFSYLEKLFLNALLILSDSSGMSCMSIDKAAFLLSVRRTYFWKKGELLTSKNLTNVCEKVSPALYRLNLDELLKSDLCVTKHEYERFHHQYAGYFSHKEYLLAIKLAADKERKRMEAHRNYLEWKRDEAEKEKAALEKKILEAKESQREFAGIYLTAVESETGSHFKSHVLGSTNLEIFESICLLSSYISKTYKLDGHFVINSPEMAGEFVKNFLRICFWHDFVHQNMRDVLNEYSDVFYSEDRVIGALYADISNYWNYTVNNRESGVSALRKFFFKGLIDGKWNFVALRKLIDQKKPGPTVSPQRIEEGNVINLHEWKSNRKKA